MLILSPATFCLPPPTHEGVSVHRLWDPRGDSISHPSPLHTFASELSRWKGKDFSVSVFFSPFLSTKPISSVQLIETFILFYGIVLPKCRIITKPVEIFKFKKKKKKDFIIKHSQVKQREIENHQTKNTNRKYDFFPILLAATQGITLWWYWSSLVLHSDPYLWPLNSLFRIPYSSWEYPAPASVTQVRERDRDSQTNVYVCVCVCLSGRGREECKHILYMQKLNLKSPNLGYKPGWKFTTRKCSRIIY